MLIHSTLNQSSLLPAVNSGSAIVFGWFVNLASVASLINYSWMCLTWIQFNRGLKAQGIERASLPFRGKFVPYAAWVGLIGCLLLTSMSLSFFGSGLESRGPPD